MPEISTPVSSRVNYRKMGEGPVLVLLHGFPESGTLWQNIWDELAACYTLIIPDFPGSGNSVLDRDTSIKDMAACVKAILDNEGVDKAVLAGHSMGGYVAFSFAAAYPGRIAGLSVIHSSPQADDAEKVKNRLKSIELIRRGAKNTFISHMIPNLFSDAFKHNNPLIVKGQVEEALKMEDAGMINFYNAMIGREDHSGVLLNAQYPIHWVVGADDNVIYFKKILGQCYMSRINFVSFYHNCGHMSMIEDPAQLAKDLKMFVDYSYTYSNKPS